MRNFQPILIEFDVVEQQNVEIECARTVGNARRAVAAEPLLDLEQAFEQPARFQGRFQLDDGIDEARLRGETHRLGAVERRAMLQAAQGPKPRSRSRQRCLRRAGPAGQIGAHPDVGRAHES